MCGNNQKKLGIVGGLGPMVTVSFLKRIITMTDACKDQDHIRMIVEHAPSIPDRTAYILGESIDDPKPYLMDACRTLKEAEVAEIAIPCVTAHYYIEEISREINIPVLDGVALCAQYLRKKQISHVGIMATDGSLKSGIFRENFQEKGLDCIYPSLQAQAAVMDLIYRDVKCGKPPEKEKFQAVTDELREKGAEVILLGCTELSVIADEWLPEGGFLDLLSVLAAKCVKDFGRLKPEYAEMTFDVVCN